MPVGHLIVNGGSYGGYQVCVVIANQRFLNFYQAIMRDDNGVYWGASEMRKGWFLMSVIFSLTKQQDGSAAGY